MKIFEHMKSVIQKRSLRQQLISAHSLEALGDGGTWTEPELCGRKGEVLRPKSGGWGWRRFLTPMCRGEEERLSD